MTTVVAPGCDSHDASSPPTDLAGPHGPPAGRHDRVSTADGTPHIDRRFDRGRRYVAFVAELARLHRGAFTTAVAGAFVFALCTVASSIAIRWVIDHVILPRFEDGDVPTATVVGGCLLIVGIGVLRAGAVVVRRSFAGIAQWRSAQTLGDRVASRLLRQPVGWHRRQSDGRLLARAGVDVDTAVSAMAPIPFALSTVLMVVVAAIWLVLTDVVLGVVAISVFPLLTILNVVYQHRVDHWFDEAQSALGEFSGAVHESFEAVQLVKAYGAADRETIRLSTMAGSIRDARIHAVRLRGSFEALLETIPSATNIGIVVLGAARVRSGDVTIGELSGFIYMFTLLVFPLRIIGYALSELPHSYAGYRRVAETSTDPLEPDPMAALEAATGEHAVELDGVSFVHAGETEAVVDGATERIRRGSITAVVGPTGAGKSTLVDLVAGLVPPTRGRIAVTPGERVVVFQEPFLFGGTVRDNLTFFDERIPDAALHGALREVGMDGWLARVGGLDARIGSGGGTLSAGEGQLLALARLFLIDPGVVILDEPTSRLDPDTEARLERALARLLAGRTAVVIAHRLATVERLDFVCSLREGRVVEFGPRAALAADADSTYARLLAAAAAGSALEELA